MKSNYLFPIVFRKIGWGLFIPFLIWGVGYLISGDPGYISNYKDSREKIMDFDRAEVVAIILEEYLDKE